MKGNLLPIISITLILSCNSTVVTQDQSNDNKSFNPSEEFAQYWWSGKAELTSYDLEQVRYGQIHQGEAVLIFVTEDFSSSKHVKLDNPEAAGDGAVNVMKLNFTKKFNTGIYPYSMMLSTFKPVIVQDHPNTLKATATSQEWCGHTFTQLDLEGDQYVGHLYSYFESEGSETELELSKVFLEDEIWNTIRLDYNLLPIGEIKIIPGLLSQRLMHTDFKVLNANTSLQKQNDQVMIYQVQYNNPERILRIFFEADFPYKITGWEDSHTSAGKALTTKATANKSLTLDYWNKNNLADSVYRKQLGLD